MRGTSESEQHDVIDRRALYKESLAIGCGEGGGRMDGTGILRFFCFTFVFKEITGERVSESILTIEIILHSDVNNSIYSIKNLI